MQSLVPKYLEQALSAFGQQQEQMRAAMQKTMGNLFPFGNMEEVSRQNVAMMERAMSFFKPFYRAMDPAAQGGGAGGADAATEEIDALRAEVAALRAQLAAKTK
jgi:polyhydroxyalkanoate synthesis regulator protein